ncbi:hypothetical protein ACI8AA_19735 [Geodermatophilus sp. SYSU D01180]
MAGLLLAAIITTSGLVVGSATAAHAVPLDNGFYKTPYEDTIYEVYGTYYRFVDEVTYSEWADAGFPPPRATPTDFVKYPWSPTIYAVTYWPSDSSDWQWDRLTYEQWQRAGFPAPRNAGYIDGTSYHQWETSPQIFAEGEDGVVHALTYSEWQAAGSPAPEVQVNEGYVKLPWTREIFYLYDLRGGYGRPINGAEWSAAGFPTPRSQPWIPGEEWYRSRYSPTIYYEGGGLYKAVTYQEWRAAGSPAPRIY